MKPSLATAALAATLFACGCAFAQVDTTNPSVLETSPMTLGPGTSAGSTTSVGPVGIPLGAMELAAPGISPPPTAAMGCSPVASPGVPSASTLFDGGGMAGAAASGCAQAGAGAAAPSASESMPTPPALSAGRAGIPLGSDEIANPGLSPMPPLTTLVTPTPSTAPMLGAPPTASMTGPSAPLAPPCPVTGSFPDGATTRSARSAGSTATMASPGC